MPDSVKVIAVFIIAAVGAFNIVNFLLQPAPSRLQKRIRLSTINKRMAGWIIIGILFLFMLIKGGNGHFRSGECC